MNFKDWLREDAAAETGVETGAETQSDATESPESTSLNHKEKQVERKSGCGSCSYVPFCVKKKKKRKHR